MLWWGGGDWSQGWPEIFQVLSHHSVATRQRRQPKYTPEPGNQKFYQLPSKYPNTHLAKPVRAPLTNVDPWNGIKEQYPHAPRERERKLRSRNRPYPNLYYRPLPVERGVTLFGRNAPEFPQFPFSFHWIKEESRKSLLELRTLKWKPDPCF